MKKMALVFTIGSLAACGSSDPADVAGNYSISITNAENGCAFADWDEGGSQSGIPIVITQSGETASADVQGGAAILLDLLLTKHVFTGTVDGNDLALQIVGTRSATEGNCTYTYNADLDAQIDGDALTGTLSYRARTNGNSDCAALEGCVTRQLFNGTRPPSN